MWAKHTNAQTAEVSFSYRLHFILFVLLMCPNDCYISVL